MAAGVADVGLAYKEDLRMAKQYKRRKNREKLFERIMLALIVVGVILTVVLVIAANQPADEGYVITADGHVHDAAGNHIGNLEDMLADGTLTQAGDGHVHDSQGRHVDDLSGVDAGTAEPGNTAEPGSTDAPGGAE